MTTGQDRHHRHSASQPPEVTCAHPSHRVAGPPAPNGLTPEEFGALLEQSQRARIAREYPNIDLSGDDHYRAEVTRGPKYTRVDFNHSGMYMIVNATGEIFGIKGYGVIHRGHRYGTLETAREWDWGGYRGVAS